MTWNPNAPEGHEASKTRWRVAPHLKGAGLDLGCGPCKILDTRFCIGVDNCKDTQLFGIQMRPDLYLDVTNLKMFGSASMDYCFSSHVLEHFPYQQVPEILREWCRVIKLHGVLALYLPASGLYPDPGTHPKCNCDHKWAVTFDLVIDAMKKVCGWDLVEYELCGKDDEYSHFFVFKLGKNPHRHEESWKKASNPEGKPTVAITRLGAFGDVIQAAAIFESFRKRGYHVTAFLSYPASELVAFDPNIDKLIVVLQDQIPIQQLGHYWLWWRKKFDHWVNLTESIEANLLAMEGNIRFEWPPAARHMIMNQNYWDLQYRIAGIPPEVPNTRFYPNEDEKKWAAKELARMRAAGCEKLILWPLAGSSRTHKVWPHIDQIFGRVLGCYPNWGIVTVGDASCQDLDEKWKGQPHIFRTSGSWTMRQVAAFIDQGCADAVVGPETGVMSIAAFYPMPKIIFLSHSTKENLSRDWTNTTSLWAPETWCPGRGKNEVPACHMMLPRFEPGCRRNEETGVAQCATEIKPEWVWELLQKAIHEGSAGTWHPPVSKLLEAK